MKQLLNLLPTPQSEENNMSPPHANVLGYAPTYCHQEQEQRMSFKATKFPGPSARFQQRNPLARFCFDERNSIKDKMK